MASRGGYHDDLDSEFDSTEKERRLTWRDDPLSHKAPGPAHSSSAHSAPLPPKQLLVDERDREELRSRRYHLLSLDAYSRHKMIMNRYLLAAGKTIEQVVRSKEKDRNDFDVLREEHRFIWSDAAPNTWEEKLAKTYYDRLFKEYAISDLSKYKEGKVALRWRTEGEVIDGKGQFVCGNRRCDEREELKSWEVNFAYVERGEKMNALVKLRLCPLCSDKLNYRHAKRQWKRKRKEKRKRKSKGTKRRKPGTERETDSSCSSSDEDKECQQTEDQSRESDPQDDMGKVWKVSAKDLVEKTKEEEFDQYLEELFV